MTTTDILELEIFLKSIIAQDIYVLVIML